MLQNSVPKRVLYLIVVLTAMVYLVPVVQKWRFEPAEEPLWNACSLQPVQYQQAYSIPTKPEPCRPSTVHLSFMVGGAGAARQLVTVIKSIIYHMDNVTDCVQTEQSPVSHQSKPVKLLTPLLHLHFIVDWQAHVNLESLFNSWELPRISFSFYKFEPFVKNISWITSGHYSGDFGSGKLLIPEILPKTIDKVIFLDIDLLLHTDIRELWNYFQKFSSTEAIGLANNQSPWYKMKNNAAVWPAIGAGFNTGVILWELKKLRQLNWNDLWTRVTREELKRFKSVYMADQDIMNAILVRHPELAHTLPCEWNMQLNDWKTALQCTVQTPFDGLASQSLPRLKISHFNSPKKPESLLPGQLPDTSIKGMSKEKIYWRQFFANRYHMFQEYDGRWLKDKLELPRQGVNDSPASNSHLLSTECSEFKAESKLRRRVQAFYLTYNITAADQLNPQTTVTLLSQMSFDRIHRLDDLVSAWSGPISVALYLTDSEAHRFALFVTQSSVLSKRINVGYHLMFKEGSLYPINELRNLAARYARTDLVFHLDIDFIPSANLHETLQNLVTSRWNKKQQVKECFVVPAFETFDTRLKPPVTKQALLNAWEQNQIVPFRHQVWTRGHLATNYSRWRNATDLYQVDWSADYEPYVVVRRDALAFDPRFVGFGWNKAAYIMGLDAVGYKMLVIPNAFVLHLPHPPSVEVLRYRSSSRYRNCIDKMKLDFIKQLAKQYGVQALKYLDFRKEESINKLRGS